MPPKRKDTLSASAENKENNDKVTIKPAVTAKRARKESSLPQLQWTHEKNKLTWMLLTEIEKEENYRVLFGKKSKTENTSGEQKAQVYRRIAEELFPDLYVINGTGMAGKIKGKIENLEQIYKKHLSKLHQTGGGLNDNTATDTDALNSETMMTFYVPPDGPDKNTEEQAVNIWEEIVEAFPFFPRLHKILATRPNAVPIAITTGVGPNGPTTLRYQEPSDDELDEIPAGVNTGELSPDTQKLLDMSTDAIGKAISAFPGALDGINFAGFDDMHMPVTTSTPRPGFDTDFLPDLSSDSLDDISLRTTSTSVSNTQRNTQVTALKPDAQVSKSSSKKASKKVQPPALSASKMKNIRKAAKKYRKQNTSIESTILKATKHNIDAINARENRQMDMEKHKLFLKEYKLGLLTKEEYREKVDELDSKAQSSSTVLDTGADSSDGSSDSDADSDS